jgi:asparagine synthase (glutamine-hydrolysing)
MCGITGAFLKTSREQLEMALRKASASMVHRGPDADGLWTEDSGRLGFAHRRLTIIDLTAEGNQPMTSVSGRYVICFNGEIYNYKELRAELEKSGATFVSHSDTEVILESVAHWGLEESVKRFVGMFAFALWDAEEQDVYLVRDRIGVKPLYFGQCNGQWAFASEIKCLRHFDFLDRSISQESLSLYMRYGYIPAPSSIYTGIQKVRAGTILKLGLHGDAPEEIVYWDLVKIAREGQANPSTAGAAEVVEELEELLEESIRLRMVADVQVGAFLSGGIDSSTVVALMQRQAARPVKTFTIGFGEKKANEAIFAKDVAEHLGTEHHELYVGQEDLLNNVDLITAIGDEPFADQSIMPTWIVSRLASEHVKVVLSGDGGDEFFGGYNHYLRTPKILKQNRRWPQPFDKLIGTAMQTISTGAGGSMARKGAVIKARDTGEIATALESRWQEPSRIVLNGTDEDPYWPDGSTLFPGDLRSHMMLRDGVRYLADDIMHKVDRASMAVSLEAREPLLDHRILEFAWTLPMDMKVRNGETKWPLREILARHVPRKLFERPKQGFGVPISPWLRGALKDWAEDLIADPSLDEHFDAKLIRNFWRRRTDNKRPRGGTRLWDVLVFLNWLRYRDTDLNDFSCPGPAPPPTSSRA